jgi:hypothetical protein
LTDPADSNSIKKGKPTNKITKQNKINAKTTQARVNMYKMKYIYTRSIEFKIND